MSISSTAVERRAIKVEAKTKREALIADLVKNFGTEAARIIETALQNPATSLVMAMLLLEQANRRNWLSPVSVALLATIIGSSTILSAFPGLVNIDR